MRPRNRIAKLRIATKSGEIAFKAATFSVWRIVSKDRGLMQSAAAIIGEIN
jgi:hypothetical protein